MTASGPPADERLARVALSVACEPGIAGLLGAVESHSAAAVVDRLWWAAGREGTRGRLGSLLRAVDPAAVLDRGREAGIAFAVPGDTDWPAAFDDLSGVTRDGRGGVPVGVWRRGPLREVSRRSVAVVGSRAASPYGVAVATDWAAGLTDLGVLVVSGAAYGVDAAAHRGALAVGGPTVAVLAGGLDQPYPRGNAGLVERVAETGALLSEAAPGSTVNRGRFLTRNRLIAALAGGVLVVEAGHRSGALSTARWALALLRPVGAVPGPVTSAMSVGSHRLVRGLEAALVTTPAEVVELVGDLGADLAPEPAAEVRPTDDLPGPLLDVREAMPARGEVSVAELTAATGLTVPTVVQALAALAERGLVDGWGERWRLRAPRRADA
jgi:DNA processing protein